MWTTSLISYVAQIFAFHPVILAWSWYAVVQLESIVQGEIQSQFKASWVTVLNAFPWSCGTLAACTWAEGLAWDSLVFIIKSQFLILRFQQVVFSWCLFSGTYVHMYICMFVPFSYEFSNKVSNFLPQRSQWVWSYLLVTSCTRSHYKFLCVLDPINSQEFAR